MTVSVKWMSHQEDVPSRLVCPILILWKLFWWRILFFVDFRPFNSTFLQVMTRKSGSQRDREYLETLFACTVLDKDSCTGHLCRHNSFNSSYLALLNCRPMQMGR